MDCEDVSQPITGQVPVFCPTKMMRADNMKCSFCHKFLSVGPVLNNGTDSVCGRCFKGDIVLNPQFSWKKQVSYEKMAEYINFPCSNAEFGCDKLVNWNEMQKHEETCKYKFKCPFSSEKWGEGKQCCYDCSFGFQNFSELEHHFENFHKELIMELPEIDCFEISSKLVVLTRILKRLAVMVMQCEDFEKLSCAVMLIGPDADANNFRYELELYDEKNNSLILRNNRLWSILKYEKILDGQDTKLMIDIKKIQEQFCSSSGIMIKLKIIESSTNEVESNKGVCLDQNILSELECPICNNYMLPPIFICKTGHSFCKICKNRMTVCPFCRVPLEDSRNFTLEKLTSLVAYPCKYKELGCFFISSSSDIEAHEMICQFSGRKCFLESTCLPVQNMSKHLLSRHPDSLIGFGSLQVLDLYDDIYECKFYGLCFQGHAFRLNIKFQESQLFFSLQQFDVPSTRFLYELEVFNDGQRLNMTTKCSLIDEPLFPNTCVSLPESIWKKYLNEGKIFFFKIHLRESFAKRISSL